MIRKIAYFLIYFILFLEILIYFLPKKELWYLAQKRLQNDYITVNYEKATEGSFSFEIKNGSIKYDKLKIASFKEAEIISMLFYNELHIKNIIFSDIVSGITPKHIESLKLYWTPLDGYKIPLKAKGDMGSIEGFIDMWHKKILIILKASDMMKKGYRKTLKEMKKSKKGYSYVKDF